MLAHLEQTERADRRYADRRLLKLQVPGATASGPGVAVLIHDLSLSGLLIETSAELAVGAELQIDLPEAGVRPATVVWSSGQYFGCAFATPLPRAALSAALLKNPIAPAVVNGREAVAVEEQSDKYPLQVRLWIMLGLAVGSWAIIAGIVALIW
jgi:hypothetical protein